MSELRIGIVGLGWVAGAHLDTFKSVKGARVAAVCSRRKQDPRELEKRVGVPVKLYADYAAMLRDPEIDVIDICTPHPLHPEQAIAAAEAGKHLIIEKPIALRYEDALAVRKAIRRAGVQACVCFEWRFCAQARMIRSLLQQGLLGELHYGEVDYFHAIGPDVGQFSWNVKKEWGGSSFLTAGCHAVDALLGFMGDVVDEVTCYGARSKNEQFAPYEYSTAAATLLRFKGGKVGKVASVIDCLQPYLFHVHLVGSHGTVLDNRLFSARLDGSDRNQWATIPTPRDDSDDIREHPYLGQFQAFVESVIYKRPMPLTDFDTAFESHRVVFAADLSAARGKPVRLSELD
jgi:predicted dehydrogenase